MVYPAFPNHQLPDKIGFWKPEAFIGEKQYLATFMVNEGKKAGFYIAVDDEAGNDASELYKLNATYDDLAKKHLKDVAKEQGITLSKQTLEAAMKNPAFKKEADIVAGLARLQQGIRKFIAGYRTNENGDLMSDLYLGCKPPWFWENYMAPFVKKATPLLDYLEKTFPKQ